MFALSIECFIMLLLLLVYLFVYKTILGITAVIRKLLLLASSFSLSIVCVIHLFNYSLIYIYFYSGSKSG